MSSLTLASISFGCIYGGVLAGLFLRNWLPAHHLHEASRDTIKIGAGLLATLAALVLGLLVSSAKNSFDTLNDGLKQGAARVIVLDRLLASYGPETKPIRDELRHNLVTVMGLLWPSSAAKPMTPDMIEQFGGMEKIHDMIRQLVPKNDHQRGMLAQAVQMSGEFLHSRLHMIVQSQSRIPWPLWCIVIFWLTMLHVAFGLLAPQNGTVIAVLLVCALSISGALFLISELNHPIDGLIQLSNAPLVKALELLGK